MLRKLFIVPVLAALAALSAFASPAHTGRTHAHASKSGTGHSKSIASHHATAAVRTHREAAIAPGRRARRSAVRLSRYQRARLLRRSEAVVGRGRAVRSVSLHRHRVVFFASPLKGSLESLTRQNEMAEAEGLERILDEDDLNARIAEKLLVPVPASAGLEVNDALPENHRYCRPWTADFLTELAQAHEREFHHPLFVSSAVRTVEYQKHLMRINGNAAAAEGDVVSPHLTGATIDIAKKGMSRQELKWMRDWLLPLQTAGQIDVEEEFRQACFHITVYKSFDSPQASPVDQTPQATTTAVVDAHGA